jgi:hypothetical protein
MRHKFDETPEDHRQRQGFGRHLGPRQVPPEAEGLVQLLTFCRLDEEPHRAPPTDSAAPAENEAVRRKRQKPARLRGQHSPPDAPGVLDGFGVRTWMAGGIH